MVRPTDLAASLGISPKKLRDWLRQEYRPLTAQRGPEWHLTEEQVAAARRRFGVDGAEVSAPKSERRIRAVRPSPPASDVRGNRDEFYVIDICDDLLGERALRQHRFDWLRGDRGPSGSSAALPVDAYYPSHRLVVEYRESQHTRPTPFFDKPDRMTVSGVHRGEQRRIYDQRRETEIPRHGLRLVIIPIDDLANRGGRSLVRNREKDTGVIRQLLDQALS